MACPAAAIFLARGTRHQSVRNTEFRQAVNAFLRNRFVRHA